MMFKLNEIYTTKAGYEARIICVDAGIRYGEYMCDIVAIISKISKKTPRPTTSSGVYYYSSDGKYCGTGNAAYDLVSNEPTEEELSLIQQMNNLREGLVKDPEAEMLKIIRQLRKPKA